VTDRRKGTPHFRTSKELTAQEDLEWQQKRFEKEKKKAEKAGKKYTEEDDYKRWHGGKRGSTEDD
jgi:hypothetical protein